MEILELISQYIPIVGGWVAVIAAFIYGAAKAYAPIAAKTKTKRDDEVIAAIEKYSSKVADLVKRASEPKTEQPTKQEPTEAK
jgi:hypothetical protein